MLQLDWSYILDSDQLSNLYAWLDDIPFKREKHKLSRDFSDGGILIINRECSLFFSLVSHRQTMSWDIELDDQLLQDLYAWIDQIPLSRPKKRIEKDFSDGVMVAELIKYYFPSWVDLHNYAAANSTQQKLSNWGLLNRKVLSRFGMNVPEAVMRGICLGRNGLIEIFLYNLRTKIDDYLYSMDTNPSDPQYRVLHQKSKTNETNSLTPRQRPSPSVDHPGHGNFPSSRVIYYDEKQSNSRPRFPGGNPPKKATSMNNLSSDYVSRIEYDEKEQECLAKDEQIQILQAKIRRLEHLLHLKDVRVEDLTEKLERLRGVPSNGHGTITTMSMNRRN